MAEKLQFSGIELGGDVYASEPEHGEIVAMMDQEDLDKMTRLADDRNAMDYAKEGIGFQEARRILIEYRTAWRELVIKYNLNPHWRMNFDYDTGAVFINKK